MIDTPLPPTPEDEAFEALSRAQQHQRDPRPEPWIWLPAGEYTATQLKDMLDGFEKMKKANSALGAGH